MQRSLTTLAIAAPLLLAVAGAGTGALDSLTAHPEMSPAAEHLLERGAWSVDSQRATSPHSSDVFDVEALVDHRQGVMRAVSGHMAATAAILFDGVPFENQLDVHGAALSGLLDDIPALFPEGSEHEESDARPEIWQDAGTFSDRSQTTTDAAAAFAEAVQGGDQGQMIQAFSALGDSCGACHEDFRY